MLILINLEIINKIDKINNIKFYLTIITPFLLIVYILTLLYTTAFSHICVCVHVFENKRE